MGVFEISGSAERKMLCDTVNMTVTFKEETKNAYEVSSKVMSECERFLGELESARMDITKIRIREDSVDEGYEGNITGRRSVVIEFPFDMKMINTIRTMLQEGRYDHRIDISFDLSNIDEIHKELKREAILNSRKIAEDVAKTLGLTVKGTKNGSIGVRYLDDYGLGKYGGMKIPDFMKATRYEKSDQLEAKKTTESETVTLKWIIE